MHVAPFLNTKWAANKALALARKMKRGGPRPSKGYRKYMRRQKAMQRKPWLYEKEN